MALQKRELGISCVPGGSAGDAPMPRLEILLVVAAAVPRLWLAVTNQGVLHPDEIFQSLEQAHRIVFGYGVVPWEFTAGARSWLFPGCLALVWKAASLLGVTRALTLIAIAKLSMVLLSSLGIWAAMRLAALLDGRWQAVLLTGVACAVFPADIAFAARCTTEAASAPLIVLSVLLLYQLHRKPAWAGILIGISIFLRYQNGIVAIGLFVMLASRRAWHDILRFGLAFAVVVLVGGMLDMPTWGRPFNSLFAYMRFNYVEDGASLFGRSSSAFYLIVGARTTGWAFALFLVGIPFLWPKASGLVLTVASYVLVHSLIPHKEIRFLVPILPLIHALNGAGLSAAIARLELAHSRRTSSSAPVSSRRRSAISLAVLVFVLAAPSIRRCLRLTDKHFGENPMPGMAPSIWRETDDLNRMLAAAGERPDICGLFIPDASSVFDTGGFTYLHRDVPLLAGANDEADWLTFGRTANYLIAQRDSQIEPFRPILVMGNIALFRRPGACAPMTAQEVADSRIASRPRTLRTDK